MLSAVYLHGLAGQYAARELSEQCVLATEVLDHLPEAMRECARVSDIDLKKRQSNSAVRLPRSSAAMFDSADRQSWGREDNNGERNRRGSRCRAS